MRRTATDLLACVAIVALLAGACVGLGRLVIGCGLSKPPCPHGQRDTTFGCEANR